MPQTASAQTTPPPSQPSISELLTTLATSSATLEQRLSERRQESLVLRAELTTSLLDLTASRQESAALSQELASSQSDLTATSSSLAQSEASRTRLSQDFDDFKNNAARDLHAVEIERDAALTAARFSGLSFKVSLGIISAVAVYEGGRAKGWWK